MARHRSGPRDGRRPSQGGARRRPRRRRNRPQHRHGKEGARRARLLPHRTPRTRLDNVRRAFDRRLRCAQGRKPRLVGVDERQARRRPGQARSRARADRRPGQPARPLGRRRRRRRRRRAEGARAARTGRRLPRHLDLARDRMTAVNLGKIGVWTSYRPFGVDLASEAAKLVEQLGYGTWWIGASPRVPDVRPVLEATSRLVAATGILNVWANDPAETAAATAAVRAKFPGRLMLGIGVGHREATTEYRTPLATMRAFLDGLDASATPPPPRSAAPPPSAPRFPGWPPGAPPGPPPSSSPASPPRPAPNGPA